MTAMTLIGRWPNGAAFDITGDPMSPFIVRYVEAARACGLDDDSISDDLSGEIERSYADIAAFRPHAIDSITVQGNVISLDFFDPWDEADGGDEAMSKRE